MSETDLSREIRESIEKLGFWCERVNSGRVKARGGWFYGAREGFPDTLVVWPYGYLESKTDECDLRPGQIETHAKMRALGIRVAVVRSVEAALRTVLRWVDEERSAFEPKGAA